LNNISLV